MRGENEGGRVALERKFSRTGILCETYKCPFLQNLQRELSQKTDRIFTL